MRGYSKIKENNQFSYLRSRSQKEYPFLDQDVDLRLTRSSSKKQVQDPNQVQLPTTTTTTTIDEYEDKNDNIKKRGDFFLGKLHENDQDKKHNGSGERVDGATLRRNFSVSSATTTTTTTYHKNKVKNNNNTQQLDRQSSTRAIQDAVKRAFSVRRSSSVNNSERYCRIYDQPMSVDDDSTFDDNIYANGDSNDKKHDDDDDDDDDDDCNNDGSIMETRSMSMKKKKDQPNGNNNSNGKSHVGSKVFKACKRLFSR